MDEKIAAALRAPFSGEAVGKLPKVTCKACSDPKQTCTQHKRRTCKTCKAYVSTAHIHIDYVGHAHVRERLMTVDPGWSWEPLALDHDGLPQIDNAGGLWIKLTVGGKTMLGYGDAPGKRNAMKELIGDALRNAAMSFGVALDLWKKETPADAQDDDGPVPPPDKASDLRSQIALLGKARKLTVDQLSEDFFQWSHGKDIRSAPVGDLAGYREYLQHREVS